MNREDDRQDPVETDRPDPPDEDADFADEHTSTTFADETPGGPQSGPEPESPTGRGGDGGMDLGTPPDEYRPRG
ncbi:hypothetical protein E1262_25090 [Jiangella aurantiaca]|uniref:Uncharacterized protein n=1 Tax=Jiangella aurantiaca TaxID=2530373 RepID=A0A4R5A488_9ACTN|nr:hypothetical protein [Jiangella aurantiaca]TDD65459.1 hypothetical protein E1262_25090 [Jiangella aurantiaca]